uniref:Uncharacterized protein TCIL3000_8_3330 n=1 Tax=Trypanosoma congolense (strain IL3000) TaxID=1068625 RepID=G0URV2_TRYCI|nr:unnamed protein product [Trypanosoma congolense IL3000]
MNLHVVSIEYTLQRPNPSLGDTAMSPLFNRVSYKCPTLHIFGYVRPREGAEGRVSGSLSGEQMQDKLQQYSACAHVHGTYPYFFVQRHDSRISAVQFGTQLEAVASKTVKHRDSQSALKRDFHGEKQLIHHVEVVWLFPFYGFSAKRQPFFKVYVIDPATVPSLLQLLYCTKEVGGREWLVCEGHSSFHFQFMVDYGAKGMAPFLIPSCVARGPLPVELKWDQLGITSIRNEDETPRLSCAQIEVDVVASSLRLRNTNIEAGENILAARRNVLQYFSDFGVDSAALRGCLSGPNERCFTVGDHQRYDLTAECLRKRAAEYIVMRAGRDMGVHQDALCDSGGSTQQLLSDLQRRVGEPVDALLPPSQSSCSQPGVNSGDMGNCGPSTLEDTYLPLNTSQQGPCEDEEMRPVDSNISRASTPTHVMDRGYLETEYEGYQDIVLSFTSTSSDSYDQSNIDDVSDSINKTKGNTLNDADDMHTGFDEQVACSRDSLSVGDTVAINPDSSTDVNKDSDCLFARVTELHSTTARLQWYVTLSETHLADCQDGLERRGCWLGKKLTLGDRSSPVTDFHEEVLLGDVEDVNPLSVIKYGPRIKVYHTYQSFIRHIEDCGTTSEGCRTGVRALLCRYNYHVRERRLSAIVPPDDEMHVTMPTSLLSLLPTSSTVNIKEANLLEEAADDDGDAELFQKRSPSKSCERSAKCSTSPLSSTPIRSLGNDMRSEQREDRNQKG